MGGFEPNEELSAIVQEMWSADDNRAVFGQDLVIDMGRRTFTRDQSADRAKEPLISYVNEDLFERETYKRFYDLLDNYESNTGVEEVMTHQEIIEMKKFIDIIVETEPMKIAKNYLNSKGWAPEDQEEFKDWLWDVWFTLYKRGRTRGRTSGDSSGFEHVFVGEIRNGQVIGFHNWIQFYRLEKMGKVDYRGFIGGARQQDSEFMITIQFTWDEDLDDSEEGAMKHVGGTMLGTSPEFEIALYTIAWVYGRENDVVNIPIEMDDQQFYVIAHTFKHKYLGSCFTSRTPQNYTKR